MKKIVTLCLAMMFGFILISCGTYKNTNDTNILNDEHTNTLNDDTNQLDELKLGEDYSTLVTISLNPSFSMYITENIVVSLKCNNEDAQNALNGNNLEGMLIEDCVFSLLDFLYQANYLNSDSKIVFDAQILDEINNIQAIDMIKKGLETYKSQHSLSFTYDITQETVSNSNDTINEDRYSVIERDENGNIVKTVEEKLNGDNVITIITIQYVNGVKAKETLTEGSYITETLYDANGLVVSESGVRDNYSYQITYVNGIRTNEFRTYNDGSKYEHTFTASGKPTDITVVTTYYANGNVESIHEYGPNGDNKYYYDIDGNKTKYEGKDNHGYPVTGTYSKDGSAVFKTKLPDGSVRVSYYDANGNFIKEEKE